MNYEELELVLKEVSKGKMSVENAMKGIKETELKDLGYAVIDNGREERVGYPEIIYCAGKTNEQVSGIVKYMNENKKNILGTRANKVMFEEVKKVCPQAEYSELGKTITIKNKSIEQTESYIAIVTAGTSDIPVAEEAAITAEIFGNRVMRIFDVGVAGIHRLFNRIEDIRGAKVIIVIAGMEGALASVIGGLVDKPIIAVPTSVGYGANFGGLAALLTMLNSCSSGVSVVNIDNGFGAGYLGGMINRL